MKYNKILFLTILVTLSGRTFAYSPSEGNINLSAGPFTYQTRAQVPGHEVKSPNRVGYGLIATGDSNAKGAIELGMFYLDKVFFRDQGPDVLAEKIQHIHITMGYRWWQNSWLSTSLSFYSAYPLGDPVKYYMQVQPDVVLDTSARDLTEYGLDFGIQTELLGNQRFGLVLEGRYSWCLTPKPNEQADHMGILLALRFMLQDKIDKPNSKAAATSP